MFQSTNQGFIDSANTWTVKSGIKHDDMEFVTMFHYCCNRNLLENRRSHFVPVTVCFKWEQHLPRHTRRSRVNLISRGNYSLLGFRKLE